MYSSTSVIRPTPVPYRSEIEGLTFTPRKYMTDDQRHASKRADVLTFSSEVLDDPLTIAGEIKAFLKVAMTEPMPIL